VVDGQAASPPSPQDQPAAAADPVAAAGPEPDPEVPADLAAFFRSLPGRLRTDKTKGWSARFHFRFKGAAHPEWTVAVDGPSCTVAEGLEGIPDCIVQSTELVYLDIEAGRQNPETAFLLGKVKVSNLGEMMKYVKAFRPVVR